MKKSLMEIAFSQHKILISTFFLTLVTEPNRGGMFLPLAAETMPAAWLFKYQVNVSDGTKAALVPFRILIF